MKHLLNDLSSSEKNTILEQYNNSLIVETKRFNKLIKSQLGDVKPLVSEQLNIISDYTKNLQTQSEKMMVGQKIRLTNALFIYGRSIRFSEFMGNKVENQFDCAAIILSVTDDKYFLKVPSITYDGLSDREIGSKNFDTKSLYNICLKIEKKDVISFEENIMQVSWLNEFVKNKIIDCNSIPKNNKEKPKQDCLKDFKVENVFRAGFSTKTANRNDGVVIYWDQKNNKWSDEYEKFTKGRDDMEFGKWKCENGNFVMFDKKTRMKTFQ